MNIQPTFEEARRIAQTGEYNILPICTELLSDFLTPIEAMRILKNVSTHCYMLESVAGNEKWGRYTFLGYDPKLEITVRNGEMKVGEMKFTTDDPSASLRQILADYFTRIAPLFFATLGAALAGILLGVKGERADLPSRNPPAARVKDPNPPMPTGAKPASKDRRAVWQIALLVLAVLFIVLGILNGSMKDVLIKAINICTECIGLG